MDARRSGSRLIGARLGAVCVDTFGLFAGLLLSLWLASWFPIPGVVATFTCLGVLLFAENIWKTSPGKNVFGLLLWNAHSSSSVVFHARIFCRNLMKWLPILVSCLFLLLNFEAGTWFGGKMTMGALASEAPLVFLIGILGMAWNAIQFLHLKFGKKRRALHDLMCGVYVVREEDLTGQR
jgi:uncharacterized RDD family membrane protein YckC